MPEPTMQSLLDDPTFPYWAKETLRLMEPHDPVDVLNVLEVLHSLAIARLEAVTDHPHPIRQAVDAVFDAAERGDIPPLTFDGGE